MKTSNILWKRCWVRMKTSRAVTTKVQRIMLAGLICIILALTPAATAQTIDIQYVYVTTHLVWTPPPKDPELPKYETSFGEFAVFYPSGRFGGGSFFIGRYRKHGAIFIIPGEGFVVWRGSWKRNSDGSVNVTSRVVYTDKFLSISKQPLPGPMKTERWVLRGTSEGRLATILKSPSEEYEPVRNMSNLGTLDKLISLSPSPDR
jgi:hypothetical protein